MVVIEVVMVVAKIVSVAITFTVLTIVSSTTRGTYAKWFEFRNVLLEARLKNVAALLLSIKEV